MAKLNSKVRKEAKAAGSDGTRKPLDPGKYTVKFTGLKVAEGSKGPYWNVELTIPKGEDNAGRKFWTIVSLSENSRFKVNEFFTALGDPDCASETDDLIGTNCTAIIDTKTQTQGAGMGELRNVVRRMEPLDEADEDDDDSDDEDDSDDDEDL